MKLLRVGTAGAERPALLDIGGTLRDLSGIVADIDGSVLADAAALDRIRAAADGGDLPVLDAEGLRVGPPVGRVGKVVCIGLNYHDHARETGAARPGSGRGARGGPSVTTIRGAVTTTICGWSSRRGRASRARRTTSCFACCGRRCTPSGEAGGGGGLFAGGRVRAWDGTGRCGATDR
ncbi:hypothetical protein SALBM135S_06896 [Streptomyces alboniger]